MTWSVLKIAGMADSKTIFTVLFWSSATAVLVVSIMPDMTVNRTIGAEGLALRGDYLLHYLAYVVMTLFLAKSHGFSWFALFLLVVFAGFQEGIQYFVEGRTLNPMDILFNVLGIITMTILVMVRYRGLRRPG